MTVATFRIGLVASAVMLAAPAQAASAKQVLESYGLLGMFAIDCTKPASRTNSYVVRRALDDDRVQHDLMHGATERAAVGIIETAQGRGPNEVATSGGNADNTVRMDHVIRVESARWRVLEMIEDGRPIISGGRFTFGAGQQLPWLNKCG
jgi:hypothetical protein